MMWLSKCFLACSNRDPTRRRVVYFVYGRLAVHRQLCDELGHVLRGEKLSTGFSGIGGIVGNQELVGIPEQVNLVVLEIPEFQPFHAFQHRRQPGVFVFHGIAQAGAGRIKIRKQAFDSFFRGVAVGGAFDGGENGL